MSSTPARLILASSSPQRKQLLTAAGYQFEVIVPDDSAEDCGICTTGGPANLVTDLALRKAADVANTLTDDTLTDDRAAQEPTLIIACDTVAECDGMVLGKPSSEDHARDMLHRLRDRRHRVFSGLCLWPIHGDVNYPVGPQTHLAVTDLRMTEISDDDLEDYLASGLWQGKAGAFGYQDRHDWLHILQGSESNVIGLPMELLAEQLAQFEVYPDSRSCGG